ncbi:MAG: hypothetical protein LBJ41_04545 [Treponema sp.]|jgi:hypothetical protein|nr:hypothetical protein [Treponema sp.]
MADFFPNREAALLEWLKNFGTVLVENAVAWGVPIDTASGLNTQITAYELVYEAAKGENGTKALIIEKDVKQKALKAELRNVKNKFIDYNEAVTKADRERLGLPRRDHKPSPIPRPTSRPTLKVLPTNNRQHTVTAVNQKTGKRSKPDDAYGVRFVWEIRDTLPVNAEDLRHSIFHRKVVTVFDYTEEDRGKKVFYAGCYENAKGDSGPWSDIIMAIIP